MLIAEVIASYCISGINLCWFALKLSNVKWLNSSMLIIGILKFFTTIGYLASYLVSGEDPSIGSVISEYVRLSIQATLFVIMIFIKKEERKQ